MHLSSFLRPFFLTITLFFPCLILTTPYVHDPEHNLAYQGITTSPGVETFLNIPYGVSTAGSNRFAPPQPFSPPPGHIFNATAAGHSCPQNPVAFFDPESEITDISEDCLNLNVARPTRKEGEGLLPVLVWIYGGSLNTGSASARATAPDGLIRQSVESGLPVLFVAMNYRLNIFGFATSEALRGSKSLNNGLRDQRLALEWIQENIEAFGGDPNRITIFGQSSGGLSVGMQVLAYGASKPVPFHSAIMQSTALEPGMSSNISFNATASIAVLAGCLNSSSPFDFDPTSPSQSPAVISCLQTLPMELLLNITDTYIDEITAIYDGDSDIFLPVVDQDFLPTLASSLVTSGKFPKMPLIIGWDEDDTTLLTPTSITTPADTEAVISLLYPYLTPNTLSTLLSLYPSSNFQANSAANLSSEFYRSAEIYRDIIFVCPSLLLGIAMAEKYSTKWDLPPVYLYANNQTLLSSFFSSLDEPGLGVTHGSELVYLFGNLSLSNFTNLGLPGYTFAPSASDYELAKQLPRSWAAFAWRDTPSLGGRETLPGWRSAFLDGNGEGEADVYVIGGGKEGMAGVGGVDNSIIGKERLGERCAFLNSGEVIEQLMY